MGENMDTTSTTENMDSTESTKSTKSAKSTKGTDKAQDKSFFKRLRSEYNKIIWPTKEALGKETVSVVTISVILGAIIAGLDLLIKFGFDKILQLG